MVWSKILVINSKRIIIRSGEILINSDSQFRIKRTTHKILTFQININFKWKIISILIDVKLQFLNQNFKWRIIFIQIELKLQSIIETMLLYK